MAYQKLRGDHVFNGKKLLGPEWVLILNEQGHKVDIIPQSEAGEEVQYIPGAILPGFVNAHCHLELAHMKGRIPEKTGLVNFLMEVIKGRQAEQQAISSAITQAYSEMEADGIRLVGDICNTPHTLPIKQKDQIRFHNFIEMIALTEAQTPSRADYVSGLRQQFLSEQPWPTTLSPHAPYTVHPKALSFLNDQTARQIITIHNQETKAENELFQTGGGDFLNLYQLFGHASSPIPTTKTSSIRAYLPYFTNGQKLILVHNTFMPEEDIIWADDHAKKHGLSIFHCFCVNANLYIENSLPNIPSFIHQNAKIVLGTDSLSSNWSLNISDEIHTILSNYDNISLEQILQWTCTTGWDLFEAEPVWITGSTLVERMQHLQ